MDIVKLVGSDVLPDEQKFLLEIGRVIRLGFLQQNAFHEVDTYVPLRKQFKMMELIIYLYQNAKELIDMGIPVSVLRDKGLFETIIKLKYEIGNEELEKFDLIQQNIKNTLAEIKKNYERMERR